MSVELRELRPLPLPCAHDRKGRPHAHLSELWACVEKHGAPIAVGEGRCVE